MALAVLALVSIFTSLAIAAPKSAPLDAATQRAYLAVILAGAKVSRTVATGSTLKDLPRVATRRQADRNFGATAAWVVANAHALPLTPATAQRINQRLRAELADGPRFRAVEAPAASGARAGRSRAQMPTWDRVLADKNLRAARRDPVAFAEKIHTETQGFNENFFDANGRTARLMADLALMQAGHAPVLYPDAAEYFRTLSPLMFGWSQRWRIQANFPAAVAAGQRRADALLADTGAPAPRAARTPARRAARTPARRAAPLGGSRRHEPARTAAAPTHAAAAAVRAR